MRTISLFILLTISLLCQAHGGDNYEHSDMLESMKPGDKAALLMVHFGTTHDDTRALTIDAINAKVQVDFPELKYQEAYTSRIIIRRLKERGIEKLTPLDALLKLRGEGYTHVFVQSTSIIDGVEMESLRKDVESVSPFFKDIRVGTPLLYSVEDAEKAAEILRKHLDVSKQRKKAAQENFVLVGHGTYTPSTAIYSQMDYILKINGLTNFHVGTVEGYPTLKTVLAQLKAAKSKRVTLVPFMFVAGEHAKNDISGEWKEVLEKEGYTVNVRPEGLGQIPDIQEIFMDHIRFGLKHRMLDIMTKKAAYAAGKDIE